MDRVATYQETVKEILELQKDATVSPSDLEKHLVMNENQDEFVLLIFGWYDELYRHSVLFHLEIREDKIWIHQNNTDVDIARRLVDAGVPDTHIVIGFVDPLMRGM